MLSFLVSRREVYPRDSIEFGRVTAIVDNGAVSAFTLLIVNIIVRRANAQGDMTFAQAFAGHLNDLLAYVVTFILVAVAWRAQHRLTSTLTGMDSAFIRATLAWVLIAVLAPMGGVLLWDFWGDPLAMAYYWGWMATLWGAESVASYIAHRHGLVQPAIDDEIYGSGWRIRGSVARVILFALAGIIAWLTSALVAALVVLAGLGILWFRRWRLRRQWASDAIDMEA